MYLIPYEILLFMALTSAGQITITGDNKDRCQDTIWLKSMESKIDRIENLINSTLARQTKQLQQILENKCTGVTTCEKTLKEVAHKKPTGQSSVFLGMSTYWSEKDVDGNFSTLFHTNKENLPYWWVDLGYSYRVIRVEIWNRQDGSGERLLDLDVTIGKSLQDMTLCAHYTGPSWTGDQFVLNCNGTHVGRFVKLTQNGTEFLHLAEVKVFAYENC